MKDKHGHEVCGHEGCTCAPREGSKYCSLYCEGAKGTTELACGCGHPGCGVEGSYKHQEEDMVTETA
jgi:hypothetical protein